LVDTFIAPKQPPEIANLANLDHAMKDLCAQAITHFAGDKDCTTPKKTFLGTTEHTAANGGLFDWTYDGKPANYESNESCNNCYLGIVYEYGAELPS
jgi:hypothetical protein